MSHSRETRCLRLVDNEILSKSRFHENEIYKGEFGSCSSSKIIEASSSSSVSSRYSLIAVITLTFPLKKKKENHDKEHETDCLQSKVTNEVNENQSTRPLLDKNQTRLRSRSRI